ncbi:MAG: D-alanyl-D-alanine carboxypeptidase family protein [Bradymonadaceae bacterium]|nr:D-alanyl-D-alanine carboxypeptidase family protein [Lujinxingiaceae bacterium]
MRTALFGWKLRLALCWTAVFLISSCGELDDEVTHDYHDPAIMSHEGNDPEHHDHDGHDHDEFGEDLATRQFELNSCTRKKNTGYVSGRSFAITVVTVDSKPVELNTANAFFKMQEAAKKSGINLRVVSGFRTQAEQQYLYNCYLTKRCNNGNLAARPGYSNHQSGHALDLNASSPGVYRWLANNAGRYGFKRTVPSENWHWEWWGKPVSNPKCTTKRWDANFSVKLAGTRGDIQPQGSSKSVPDQFVGDAIRGVAVFHNKSTEKLVNVRLGYELPSPHFVAENYVIYRSMDGKNWSRASANGDSRNPAKARLGKGGTIYLGNFAPKERKQVVVTLRAKRYSIGEVGHPRVSFWIKRIDNGVYGPAATYGTKPGTNKFGSAMRGRRYADVFSKNEWQFNTGSKYNLEGWAACRKGHHDQLYKPNNAGVMRMRVTGDNSCVRAPSWTNINANAYDQIVIRTRSFDGAHQMGILFGATGTTPWSGKRMVRFDGRGNGNYHTMVIQMSDHPEWKGTIRRLRIDPLEGRKPKAGARALYDIDRVFFQSSKTRRTSSARQVYVDRPAISPICTELEGDEHELETQIIGYEMDDEEEEDFTVLDGDVEEGAEPIVDFEPTEEDTAGNDEDYHEGADDQPDAEQPAANVDNAAGCQAIRTSQTPGGGLLASVAMLGVLLVASRRRSSARR